MIRIAEKCVIILSYLREIFLVSTLIKSSTGGAICVELQYKAAYKYFCNSFLGI